MNDSLVRKEIIENPEHEPTEKALALVLWERQRQIAKGNTPEHDDDHLSGELAIAAACYAVGPDDVSNCGVVYLDERTRSHGARNSTHARSITGSNGLLLPVP